MLTGIAKGTEHFVLAEYLTKIFQPVSAEWASDVTVFAEECFGIGGLDSKGNKVMIIN
jgi:hypothetical protein